MYQLARLGLGDVVDIDEHDLETPDKLRPFPLISLEKFDIKHVPCVFFLNMMYPLVELGLVDVFPRGSRCSLTPSATS